MVSSVAVDIVMACEPGCYTLISDRLDDNGEIINPVRIVQEAGLYDYMRTLDIQFSHGASLAALKRHLI